jgi:hypothetical protein
MNLGRISCSPGATSFATVTSAAAATKLRGRSTSKSEDQRDAHTSRHAGVPDRGGRLAERLGLSSNNQAHGTTRFRRSTGRARHGSSRAASGRRTRLSGVLGTFQDLPSVLRAYCDPGCRFVSRALTGLHFRGYTPLAFPRRISRAERLGCCFRCLLSRATLSPSPTLQTHGC